MKKEILKISVFVLISLIVGGGAVYLLNPPEGYLSYSCNDTGELVIDYCHDIDDSPTFGKDVMCRKDINNNKTYKRCLDGWKLYQGENVTGTIIDLPDYIEYTDNELLKKQGIKEIKVSKCQRVSKDFCEVKILHDTYRINITNVDSETDRLYNKTLNNYLKRLRIREQINQEKEFYKNQTYGIEKIVSIKDMG